MKQTHSAGGIDSLRRIHRLRRIVAWLVLVVMGIAGTGVALAATRGSSTQGRALVSGGVGFAERQASHARRDDDSLRRVTAATRSCAFLSGVRAKITDAEKHAVFEGSLDGRWPAAGARCRSARPVGRTTAVGAW